MLEGGVNFTHSISDHTNKNFLVTTGPYNHVRHPGYCGFFIWIIGIQMLLANPINLILAVLVLRNFFLGRIEEEERILYERYNKAWLEYCKIVQGRLFPAWSRIII